MVRIAIFPNYEFLCYFSSLFTTGKLDTIAMTSAGNLKCRKIFHVNLEKELEVVNACLSKAEELKLSSLSFPLLMTGHFLIKINKK